METNNVLKMPRGGSTVDSNVISKALNIFELTLEKDESKNVTTKLINPNLAAQGVGDILKLLL